MANTRDHARASLEMIEMKSGMSNSVNLPPTDAATDRTGRAILLGGTGLVLLGWVVAIASVTADRRSTLAVAELDLRNTTRAYAEHVDKTLQAGDQALRFVRAEYLRRQPQALDLQAYVAQGDIIQADFNQLGIIGADGWMAASSMPFSRVDLSEREHFRVHRQGQGDSLFLSKPVLGKVSGKWSLQMTRRITLPDGRFGGVAVVSLAPAYFSRFFAAASLGQDLEIALVGLDGIVRASAPDGDQRLGADLSRQAVLEAIRQQGTGIAYTDDGLGAVPRVWAFQTLPGLGLAVMAGKSQAAVLAEWQTRSLGIGLAAALVTACVGLLGLALHRRMRRQAELVQALQASTGRLRSVVSMMAEGSCKVTTAGSTMSESAQTLAIRTERQGEQVTRTYADVREVVGQVLGHALHIGDVESRCSELRTQTDAGRAVVDRSVAAIEGIVRRTDEMGEAVAMIEAIAFQTNLLAVNASVESARAGEAGKAFAIVADQVRQLAERSRQSAGQVRQLIAGAGEQVKAGVIESAAVQQVLDGLSRQVSDLAAELRGVVDESNQQSTSLQRAMEGLEQLDALTRSNADMVARSVWAAEDMREHAERLRGVVTEIERDLPVELVLELPGAQAVQDAFERSREADAASARDTERFVAQAREQEGRSAEEKALSASYGQPVLYF